MDFSLLLELSLSQMKGFLFGFILGIASATVGFSGLAPMLDSAVRGIQQQTIKITQKSQQEQVQNYDITNPASSPRIAN